MKEFIDENMDNFFEEFKSSVKNLSSCCILKSLRYNSGNLPDYSLPIIQQLYLLRYFPAYIIEYYYIYKKLISKNFLSKYNILSIGSGCCVDYYGLYFAVNNNQPQENFNDIVCYTGVDQIDWNYRDCLGNENFYFINEDITNWTNLDWDNYNIIMFPKSIGEFSNTSFKRLIDLLKNSSFKQNKICLISSVREQNDVTDIKRMSQIVDVFKTNHEYRGNNSIRDTRGKVYGIYTKNLQRFMP